MIHVFQEMETAVRPYILFEIILFLIGYYVQADRMTNHMFLKLSQIEIRVFAMN